MISLQYLKNCKAIIHTVKSKGFKLHLRKALLIKHLIRIYEETQKDPLTLLFTGLNKPDNIVLFYWSITEQKESLTEYFKKINLEPNNLSSNIKKMLLYINDILKISLPAIENKDVKKKIENEPKEKMTLEKLIEDCYYLGLQRNDFVNMTIKELSLCSKAYARKFDEKKKELAILSFFIWRVRYEKNITFDKLIGLQNKNTPEYEKENFDSAEYTKKILEERASDPIIQKMNERSRQEYKNKIKNKGKKNG